MSINRKIYFNEEAHKYTDDIGNQYVSVTTLLGDYHEKFNAKLHARRLAKENNGRGIGKYAGKNWKQIIAMWEVDTKKACDKGSAKHNFLEDTIKKSSNFVVKTIEEHGKGRLYDIQCILTNHDYGRIDLSFFITSGIKDRYPVIYNIIESLHNKGYRIYAEIGVFWYDLLISGMVDVLFVRGDEFIILDWKTNKDIMPHIKDHEGYSIFKPGYFKKDRDGRVVKWVDYVKYMFSPIDHIYDVTGNHYMLQLSLYARLIEYYGLTCKELVLCHIRDDVDEYYNKVSNNEIVDVHRIVYHKTGIEEIIRDRQDKLFSTRENQMKLDMWN